ncbi:unnamed protein product [Chrysoparadoxa australica]
MAYSHSNVSLLERRGDSKGGMDGEGRVCRLPSQKYSLWKVREPLYVRLGGEAAAEPTSLSRPSQTTLPVSPQLHSTHTWVFFTQELKELQKQPLDFATCGPVDEENILHWNATLMGPDDSPFSGGIFNIDLDFPADYPFKAPKVRFLTRVYHPNVKTDTGEICADIIGSGWGPTLNVQYVLRTIRQLLIEPHTDNPLEADIAKQLEEDRSAFDKTVRQWTADYAR